MAGDRSSDHAGCDCRLCRVRRCGRDSATFRRRGETGTAIAGCGKAGVGRGSVPIDLRSGTGGRPVRGCPVPNQLRRPPARLVQANVRRVASRLWIAIHGGGPAEAISPCRTGFERARERICPVVQGKRVSLGLRSTGARRSRSPVSTARLSLVAHSAATSASDLSGYPVSRGRETCKLFEVNCATPFLIRVALRGFRLRGCRSDNHDGWGLIRIENGTFPLGKAP